MTAEQDNFIAGVEAVVARIFDNVSTSFPATIIDPLPPEDSLVNVQPNIKIKFLGNEAEVEPKPINNVILVYSSRTEGTIIRPPKEYLIGSKVMVHISEHSLTEWRESRGQSKFPEESRRFNINDAVAVLGAYPETLPWFPLIPQLKNTFEIAGITGTKFQIGTPTAELLDIVLKLITALIGSGVLPGATVTLLTALQTLMTTITNPKP